MSTECNGKLFEFHPLGAREVRGGFDGGLQLERNSFLTDRNGNVIENKGPLWETWGQSWNVYENKGT